MSPSRPGDGYRKARPALPFVDGVSGNLSGETGGTPSFQGPGVLRFTRRSSSALRACTGLGAKRGYSVRERSRSDGPRRSTQFSSMSFPWDVAT